MRPKSDTCLGSDARLGLTWEGERSDSPRLVAHAEHASFVGACSALGRNHSWRNKQVVKLINRALLCALVCAVVAGCGGKDDPIASDKGTGGASDGTGGSNDGSGGSADASGGTDTGTGGMIEPKPEPEPEPEPAGPLLNTPDAELSTTHFDVGSEGLFLVSSNLTTKPSLDQWFEEWYAVIGNDGPSTLCYVQAEVDFLSGGVIVAEHYSYAGGAPFESSDSTTGGAIPCIAPGEEGIIYSNAFATSNLGLSSVDSIEVILVGSDYNATPHAMAPTYTPMATADWTVSGVATAVANVYNLAIDVYAYDEAGFVYDRQTAYHLDPLYAGGTWEFETYAFDQEVVEFQSYIDFLPGSGAASFKIGAPELSELEKQRATKARLDAQHAKNKEASLD